MRQGQLLAFLAAALLLQKVSAYVRVCYYTNWSQYRPGAGWYVPSKIDASLCTHIIYAFAQVTSAGLLGTYEWNDITMYAELQSKKRENPSLKTLLAVGGWNHGSYTFSEMVKTAQRRSLFINDVISKLRAYGFDGFDLDWEYPAQRGSPPGDKQLFTALCAELRAAFTAEGIRASRPRLLLTAAVAAGVGSIDTSYEVTLLKEHLDFINLMTYDLYGSWETRVNHHTSMTASPHNVPNSVRYWIDQGMPPQQIALGLATYGRSFGLAGLANGIGAPAATSGRAGEFTRENGFLAYYEICNIKWNFKMDYRLSAAQAPYSYDENSWVGFDDESSLVYKVNELIIKNNLLGAMFWALDLDDFSGTFCGAGPYPLLKAVKQALEGNTPPTAGFTGTAPTTISDISTTASKPGANCRSYGAFENWPGMDSWCENNCPVNCPLTHCICEEETSTSAPTTRAQGITTTPAITTSRVTFSSTTTASALPTTISTTTPVATTTPATTPRVTTSLAATTTPTTPVATTTPATTRVTTTLAAATVPTTAATTTTSATTTRGTPTTAATTTPTTGTATTPLTTTTRAAITTTAGMTTATTTTGTITTTRAPSSTSVPTTSAATPTTAGSTSQPSSTTLRATQSTPATTSAVAKFCLPRAQYKSYIWSELYCWRQQYNSNQCDENVCVWE